MTRRGVHGSTRLLWVPAFLEELQELGTVTGACEEAGIAKSRVYELRQQDPIFLTFWELAQNGMLTEKLRARWFGGWGIRLPGGAS